MQLLPSGVHVSIAYPPDTDTPGYANENTTKVGLYPEGCTSIDAIPTAIGSSSGVADPPSPGGSAACSQSSFLSWSSQALMCMVQPPVCHAISRAAGDVLYTPEQVIEACS